MADRYWIGDSGTASDTTHWSTSSGGSGGASVPGNTDKAIIDINSGAGLGTITLDSSVTVGELYTESPFNDVGVRLVGNSGFTVRGDVTLEKVTMLGGAPTAQRVQLDPQSGNNSNITMVGGSAWGEGQFNLNADGTVTLQSDLALTSTTSTFNFIKGAFTLNGYDFQCRKLTIGATGTMDFGNGDVNINQSAGTANFIDINASSNITGGSGTIRFTGNGGPTNFGGKTFNRVEFNHPSGIGSVQTTTGNTFDYVYIGGTHMKFLNSTTTTSIITTRVFEAQGTPGTTVTLSSISGTAAICAQEYKVNYAIVGSINSACASPYDDPSVTPTSTDGGGNSNWLFTHWFKGIAGYLNKEPFVVDPIGNKPQGYAIIDIKPKV